jgi:hypothetical protein
MHYLLKMHSDSTGSEEIKSDAYPWHVISDDESVISSASKETNPVIQNNSKPMIYWELQY